MNDLTPRIYVACLAAYNNGQLHGAWIDADQSADAIHEAIRAMLAASPIPGAEEWTIHDYEDFVGGISPSEYDDIDRVAEIAALLVEYGEPFGAWYSYDPSADVSDFQDAYRGEYDSEEAYAEEYIGDTGMLDSIPENLRYYFDVKKFARDMFMFDMHSVRSSHGTVYVFERN